MSEEPQKQHSSTLDWPIWIQVVVTLGLITGLAFALHVSKQNNALPESDDVVFANKAKAEDPETDPEKGPENKPIEPPAKEDRKLPLPEKEWQGKRVLTADLALARMIADLDAEVSWYSPQAGAGLENITTITPAELAKVEKYDVILVVEHTDRPPKAFARKVGTGALLFILEEDGSWREYREDSGMLRTPDQR